MFPRTTGRNWPRNTIEELIKQEFRTMIKSGEIPTGGGAPAMGSVWDSMITFRHGARVIQRDPVTRIDSRMRLSMFNKNTYYDAGGLWKLDGIRPAGYQKYNEGLIYGHHPGFDDLYYDGVSYVGAELDFDSRNGFRFFGLETGSNYTFPWSTPKVWIFSEDISGTSGAATRYPVTVWIAKTSSRLIVYDDVPPVEIIVCEYSLTEDIVAPPGTPISGTTVSIANPGCYYVFPAYAEGTDTDYLENTLFTSTLINGCIMLSIPNEYGAYLYNITDDEILKLVFPGQDNITVQHVSLGYGV